jgi:hypothetical protein
MFRMEHCLSHYQTQFLYAFLSVPSTNFGYRQKIPVTCLPEQISSWREEIFSHYQIDSNSRYGLTLHTQLGRNLLENTGSTSLEVIL